MSRPRRLATALLITASVALTQAGLSLAGSGSTVDCGQVTAYTAPDPVGPAVGSLGIGTLTPWEVVPTATVSVAAAASLPSLVNSSPTCVTIELDTDGKVTSIDFAPEGTASGTVTYDSGSGFYLFAERLIVPDFITDAYPGLDALFATSAAAGSNLTVNFSVDVTNGAFTGLGGHAEFCGAGSVTGDGDGKVGDATLLAAVLDGDDIDALEEADGDDVCAMVDLAATIVPNSEGQIDVTTDVEIELQDAGAVPTQPATSTANSAASVRDGDLPVLLLGLAVCLGIILATSRLTASTRRR